MTPNIENVVVPEDDDPKKVLMSIERIRRAREADLLQLGRDLKIDITKQNWLMRVVSFCHRQNEYFWYLTSTNTDLEKENIEECIKLMAQVTNNPSDLMKMQLLAHDVGLEYRKYRVELELV